MKQYDIQPGTIIRTALLILALINQALTIAGKPILPITDQQLSDFLSLVLTVGASLWAWWKNNSFTQAALEADTLKDALKKRV